MLANKRLGQAAPPKRKLPRQLFCVVWVGADVQPFLMRKTTDYGVMKYEQTKYAQKLLIYHFITFLFISLIQIFLI